MKVYTYHDPKLEDGPVGHIVRAWDLSWRARGWKTQLLPPRLAEAHRLFGSAVRDQCPLSERYWFDALCAFATVEGIGVLVDFRTLNESLTPSYFDGYIRASRLGLDKHGMFIPWGELGSHNYLNSRPSAGVLESWPSRGRLTHFKTEDPFEAIESLGPYVIEK